MKKVFVFLSCMWLAVNVLLAEEPYKYEYLYKDLPLRCLVLRLRFFRIMRLT